MKVRRNISVDLDTNEELKELAKEAHTNVSQWITDQVWKSKSSSKTGKGLVK